MTAPPPSPDSTAPPAGRLGDEVGKHRPFDLPEQEAYLNLVRTASVLRDDFARLFKQHGLSETGYNVLRILRGGPDTGTPCLRVADQLVCKTPDITRLTTRLVGQGMLRRVRDDDDRRVVRLVLTPVGRDTLDRLDQPLLDLHQRQLGHLSPRQLASLNRLLEKARHPPPEADADPDAYRPG